MSQREPSEEFRDLVDAMTTPKPPPSATIRVAELHFGNRGLAPAIRTAGMEVAATLDGTRELPDFDTMPPFDLVVADVTEEPSQWQASIDYVMRFLRVRRPVAFMLLGHSDEQLRTRMMAASQPYGYEVERTRADGLDFLAGVLEREPEQAIKDMLIEAAKRIRDGVAEGC